MKFLKTGAKRGKERRPKFKCVPVGSRILKGFFFALVFFFNSIKKKSLFIFISGFQDLPDILLKRSRVGRFLSFLFFFNPPLTLLSSFFFFREWRCLREEFLGENLIKPVLSQLHSKQKNVPPKNVKIDFSLLPLLPRRTKIASSLFFTFF